MVTGFIAIANELVALVGKLVALIGQIYPGGRSRPQRNKGFKPIQREALTQKGRELIEGVKDRAILFGGDCSWAEEYRLAIRAAREGGKLVVVICPTDRFSDPKPRRNLQVLAEAGAILVMTPVDIELRGVLVDPDDQEDCLYYASTRQLRAGSPRVEPGWPGGSNYDYLVRMYKLKTDPDIMEKVVSLYRLAAATYLPGDAEEIAQSNNVP